ncbi:MAG: hypothetical protein JRC77_05715, partial [Deltaproteobacteria bacterium]|nr:hypothetical protein [Deltaproteobacteria bacterium]
TCLRFFVPGGNSTQALVDFSYLYLYEIQSDAGDPQLEAFKASITPDDLLEVANRHGAGCFDAPREALEPEDLRCVLGKMIPRHEIRAEEIRLDEHATYSSELKLEDQLGRP